MPSGFSEVTLGSQFSCLRMDRARFRTVERLRPAIMPGVRNRIGSRRTPLLLGRMMSMSHRMDEFTSIEPGQVAKLREAGIENSDDMMRLWADQPKRQALMEKTGIDEERFTRFVSMSRLARVKNVGPKYVDVLLA